MKIIYIFVTIILSFFYLNSAFSARYYAVNPDPQNIQMSIVFHSNNNRYVSGFKACYYTSTDPAGTACLIDSGAVSSLSSHDVSFIYFAVCRNGDPYGTIIYTWKKTGLEICRATGTNDRMNDDGCPHMAVALEYGNQNTYTVSPLGASTIPKSQIVGDGGCG